MKISCIILLMSVGALFEECNCLELGTNCLTIKVPNNSVGFTPKQYCEEYTDYLTHFKETIDRCDKNEATTTKLACKKKIFNAICFYIYLCGRKPCNYVYGDWKEDLRDYLKFKDTDECKEKLTKTGLTIFYLNENRPSM